MIALVPSAPRATSPVSNPIDDGGMVGRSKVGQQEQAWTNAPIGTLSFELSKKGWFGRIKHETKTYQVNIDELHRTKATSLDDAKALAQKVVDSNDAVEAAVLQAVDGAYYVGVSKLTYRYYQESQSLGNGLRTRAGWYLGVNRQAIGSTDFGDWKLDKATFTSATDSLKALAILGEGRPAWPNRPAS